MSHSCYISVESWIKGWRVLLILVNQAPRPVGQPLFPMCLIRAEGTRNLEGFFPAVKSPTNIPLITCNFLKHFTWLHPAKGAEEMQSHHVSGRWKDRNIWLSSITRVSHRLWEEGSLPSALGCVGQGKDRRTKSTRKSVSLLLNQPCF